MKLLADHCVFGKTIRLLREQGHEVLTLKELNHASSPDEIVLQLA
jgi:predicted nuclease of predicted toxin-antitoxin system